MQPTVLLQNARVAPNNIGPKSTGTQAEYEALANAAIHPVGASGMKVFTGQRDEGFYVDLAGAFDLINPRNPGVDSTSGFNVHTIAIEVPKSRFADVGDTDGRIGVWATASRERVRVLNSGGSSSSSGDTDSTRSGDDSGSRPRGALAQVSRLANPLVNEVLMPLRAKDRYNTTEPRDDASNIRNFIVNPGTSQGAAALIPLLNGLTGCTATTGRADLEAALLLGIPGGLVPGFAGNRETQRAPVAADLLRLNYNIAPATAPNRMGLLGGDIAGFPNGRRVGDDVTDIALQAAGGVLQPLVGLPACAAAGTLTDNVNGNDRPYLTQFPYLGTPWQGYTRVHLD